jgi:hypothetical protein
MKGRLLFKDTFAWILKCPLKAGTTVQFEQIFSRNKAFSWEQKKISSNGVGGVQLEILKYCGPPNMFGPPSFLQILDLLA